MTAWIDSGAPATRMAAEAGIAAMPQPGCDHEAGWTRARSWAASPSRRRASRVNAFNDYMTAMKLPKDTDEQKKHRSQLMQEGLKKAINVPLGVM
ncbi:MAG: cyclodeaminase/cyclohydrolase family protein, partial [Planctomycetes bacterium]|nr:cyclodeaminase/cyclohydrolase family protein [Planctomycetota bacterium]